MPAGYDPVVNVNVHTDGRYAFVELRTPDMASASLQLNGQVGGPLLLLQGSRVVLLQASASLGVARVAKQLWPAHLACLTLHRQLLTRRPGAALLTAAPLQVQLLGATLSIGRPSGYVDPGKAAAAATVAAEALARFQVASCPCPLLFLPLGPLPSIWSSGEVVWLGSGLQLGLPRHRCMQRVAPRPACCEPPAARHCALSRWHLRPWQQQPEAPASPRTGRQERERRSPGQQPAAARVPPACAAWRGAAQ